MVINIVYRLLTSQTCHHYIWSPTLVTNIHVTDSFSNGNNDNAYIILVTLWWWQNQYVVDSFIMSVIFQCIQSVNNSSKLSSTHVVSNILNHNRFSFLTSKNQSRNSPFSHQQKSSLTSVNNFDEALSLGPLKWLRIRSPGFLYGPKPEIWTRQFVLANQPLLTVCNFRRNDFKIWFLIF